MLLKKLQHELKGDAQKKISIYFQKDLNGWYAITIGDNGCGFPKDIDFKNTESLGLQLVMSLIKQLEGEISKSDNLGTEYFVRFKENKQ